MGYRNIGAQNKDTNQESEAVKKPKCVSVAFWWFIAWSVICIVVSIFLGDSCPWTIRASTVVVIAMMMYCSWEMTRRNLVSVLQMLVALTGAVLLVMTDAIALVWLLLVPTICVILPSSVKWLKVNWHYSWLVSLVAIVSVGICGVLKIMPSITDTDISNTNPLWMALPGDKAVHELDGSCRHEYQYWQHGLRVGRYIVQYNQRGECSYVRMDVWSSDDKTKDEYEELFFENVKNFCDQRFSNHVQWSDALTSELGPAVKEGLPMLCGYVKNKLIMIFPREEEDVYGTLLICDSQLNSELDFLFSLPEEDPLMSKLSEFLGDRDRLLAPENDDDDAQRSKRKDVCDKLSGLRAQSRMLLSMATSMTPPVLEIEDSQMARRMAMFQFRRNTMRELSLIIWSASHLAVTAMEYVSNGQTMQRDELKQYRRQYIERESDPVVPEILPLDLKDHSGQKRIFENVSTQFNEEREALYWALHKATEYDLGRVCKVTPEEVSRVLTRISPKNCDAADKRMTRPAYGKDLPSSYGGNNKFFFRRRWTDPTSP